MHEISVSGFLGNLLVILFSAKLFSARAEHWKQPAVLGELLGGVVLGFGLVSFFHPNDPTLSLMAEFGVILLLFQTGLESDRQGLLRVGPVALAVALVGVALPLLTGYGLMRLLGHTSIEAVLVSAALWIGPFISRRHIQWADKLKTRGTLITASVCFAFALALLAHALGSALIVGAFTAGLLLGQTDRKADIEISMRPVADIFVPFCFGMVGASVNLSNYNPIHWDNWAIMAMHRGEVGLIFAQIGLSFGVIKTPMYAALIGMVVVTTLITPPLLSRVFSKML